VAKRRRVTSLGHRPKATKVVSEDRYGRSVKPTVGKALRKRLSTQLSKWSVRLVGDATTSTSSLRALTPGFDPEEHSSYVVHLQSAIEDPHLRNIALTGGYGTGKSSILSRFVQIQQQKSPRSVVELSLATIGINSASQFPDLGDSSEQNRSKLEQSESGLSKTNRIERELVKQLLYSSPPKKGSRFQRIKPLDWPTAIWRSILVFGMTLATLLLFDKVPARFPGLPDGASWAWHLLALIALLAGLVSISAWLQRALNGRFSIQNVSVGSATVSLGENSASYFDKYLDEIIHFFTQSEVRVVVLEDIDRFNDPFIFEELRELNSLVNRDTALSQDPVRFVYALKDSIFEQLLRGDQPNPLTAGLDWTAEGEALSGIRTKFFDLVIPVVPFITPRTARDHLRELLNTPTGRGISDSLVSLVARRLPDMRLLKNICNEYQVFAEHLLLAEPDDTLTPLEPDKLFAMLVFKNTCLEEFEKITRGTSVLDRIYTQSRVVVRRNLEHNENLIRQKRQALRNTVNPAEAEHMGNRLTWFINQLVEFNQLNFGRATRLNVGAEEFELDAICSQDFWVAVAESRSVTVQTQRNNGFALAEKQLQELLSNELSTDVWRRANASTLESELSQLAEANTRLRSCDFAELSADLVPLNPENPKGSSFKSDLEEQLGSGLALELVQAGYIDQNFVLYAGQYYGEFLSKSVMNFIVRHVQPNSADFDYPLRAEEVISLLSEQGTAFLGEQASFNKDLLDHLFDTGDKRTSQLLAGATLKGNVEGLKFLELYIQESRHRNDLASTLSRTWPGTFNLLLMQADLADVDRLSTIDAALREVDDQVDYTALEELRDFVHEHAAELTSLTEQSPADHTTELAIVLTQAGCIIDDLDVLSETLREAVVARNAYAISPHNLRVALDGSSSLALDIMRSLNETVFERCIASPDEFLDAISVDQTPQFTVASHTEFAVILNAATGWDEVQVSKLVSGSNPNCVVVNLKDAAIESWPALASNNRFPPTLTNVMAYIEEFSGEIDEDLAVLLAASPSIETSDDFQVEDVRTVATAVLNAAEFLTADQRVMLAKSLPLTEHLPASRIPSEAGELFGLLLKQDLVADAEETFVQFVEEDWTTYEHGIVISKEFEGFVSPSTLPERHVEPFLTSNLLDSQLQLSVLRRFAEFAPNADAPTLKAAARFAIKETEEMPAEFLQLLAAKTKDSTLAIPLLNLALGISAPELREILAQLGDEYSGFSNGPGTKISLPDDSAHRSLIERLRNAGLAGSPAPTKIRRPGRMNVTLR
jgi:hypothetical protein